jgi:hypothetical protein
MCDLPPGVSPYSSCSHSHQVPCPFPWQGGLFLSFIILYLHILASKPACSTMATVVQSVHPMVVLSVCPTVVQSGNKGLCVALVSPWVDTDTTNGLLWLKAVGSVPHNVSRSGQCPEGGQGLPRLLLVHPECVATLATSAIPNQSEQPAVPPSA